MRFGWVRSLGLGSLLAVAIAAGAPGIEQRTAVVGPFLGEKPGRDLDTRGGMWNRRTLADLAEVVQAERMRTLDGVIASLEGGGGEGGEEHLAGPALAGEGSGASAASGGAGAAGGGGSGVPGAGGTPGVTPVQGGWGNPGTGLGPGGVNTHTGNKLTRVGLIHWPSRGRTGVGLTLYHNSLTTYSGPLGPKWSHSYDVSIAHTPGSSAIIRWGNGLRVAYTESQGNFAAPPGFHEKLVRLTDQQGQTTGWVVTTHSQMRLEFGAHGLLTAIKDRWGNTVVIARDAGNGHRITSVTCPEGRAVNFTYGTNGLIETIWAGNQDYDQDWILEYSLAPARLEKVKFVNPDSGDRPYVAFGYDGSGRILSYRDRRTRLWIASYTPSGRCAELKTPHPMPDQAITTFTYFITRTTIKLPEGQEIDHNYASGLLASVRDPDLGGVRPVEAYLYDADRNVRQVTDRRGKVWTSVYDGEGNLLTATNPLGKTTTYTYGSGNELETIRRHGEAVGWAFLHQNGEVTRATDPMGRVVYEALYTSEGELDWTKDAGGLTTEYDVEPGGDRVRIRPPGVPQGNEIELDYLFGRLTRMGDQFSAVTTIEYDAWLRPRRMIHPPDGGPMVWEEKRYDHESNLIKHLGPRTDSNGNPYETTYAYDPAGWLTGTTNARGESEVYGYSKNGWLRTVLNGRGKLTTYLYSNRGERTGILYPGGTSESWSYDHNGAVDLYTNGMGQTQDFVYDDAGRLERVVYGSGPDTVFGYDDWDRRTSMVEGSSSTTWAFNLADQLIVFSSPQGVVNYDYRPDTQLLSMEEVGLGTTVYGYDPVTGLPSSTTNPHAETTARHYEQGRLAWVEHANGVRESYEYDHMSRVSTITRTKGLIQLGEQIYGYDPAGNVTRHVIDGVETLYGYDPIDQLTSETRPGYSAVYDYDANGNRLTRTVNGVTETYHVNDRDELQEITVGGVTVRSFTYDLAGRMTSSTTSAGTRTFAWDARGRMTSTTFGASTNAFAYNGLGARVGISDSLGSRQLRRAGASVLAPVLGDGLATYTPGISERRAGTSTFQHAGIKSFDAQTDELGAVSATRRYDAFGATLASAGPWPSPFAHAGPFGYQTDPDTGLQLLGHRYYDPTIGRFLSRDPAKDGRNWHTYCWNNPIALADADGRTPLHLAVGAGLLIWRVYDTIQTAREIANNPHDISNYVGFVPAGKLLKKAAKGINRPGSTIPIRGGPPGGTRVENRGNGGTIRKYDEDGNAKTDYDFGHDHGAGDPHAHDWMIGPNGKPRREKGRPILPWETY